ncbi:sodium:solute symporter family protein [Pelagicoccus sp. SDUM812003]|uniref:sodium:solute symporter family protein n=1 Tax=Pelagicoccus sp. SDUM812003 TaxID=3041267 RepID=UPI00280EDEAA|nr:sodium:solute symporter family protein [Pelagicoccus sp. SDUM812003]MDQ8204643.1 sodium:solute symporter family protein [Pelagicoccus sp. SDUM812003]
MTATQIAIAIAAILYLAFMAVTRRRVSFDEFATAGRSMGPWLTFAGLAATFVGPAMTMGLTRAGYQVGWLYLPCAILAGTNLLLISQYVAQPMRSKFAGARSLGEVTAGPKSHNSKTVRLLIACIGFSLTAAISIVMSKASGELLNHAFGLPRIWGILLGTGLVTAYSCRGGIRATMQTDAVQLCGFALLVPMLLVCMVASPEFSWTAWKQSSLQSTQSAFDSHSTIAFFSLFVFWFLGSGFDPTNVNRILSARSPSVSKRSMRRNGFFVIVWMSVMYLLGTIGQSVAPALPINDQIILALGQTYFGSILYALFIVAMLGVILSTQDSMLNGASVLLANDIARCMRPKLTERQQLRIAVLSTLALGVLSVSVSFLVDSILQAIIFIWSVYTPSVAPVVIASLYLEKPKPFPAIVSIISGFSISSSIVFSGYSSHIPAVFAGLLASSAAYLIAHRSVRKSVLKEKEPCHVRLS